MPSTFSPLRYPGGKTKLYSFVRSLLDINGLIGETYIEPFAGGSGLALKLLFNNDVKRIVINDLDSAVYSFWYCVLNYTDQMLAFVNEVPLTVNEWDYQHSVYINQNNHTQLELAQATLFLNRTNISGIIKGGIIGGREQNGKFRMDARFNREGISKKIIAISSMAQKIDLYNMDAGIFINDVLKHYYKVLINFDPPYVKKGGQLYRNAFTKEDHKILRNKIVQCKRKWVVTYDVCDYVADLYSNYRGSVIDIQYSANSIRRAQEYAFFSNNMIIPEEIEIM